MSDKIKKIEPYVVESNVPIPVKVLSLPPLRELKVGESIVFPLEKRPSVQTAAFKLKRDEGLEFRVKKLDETSARIWRTK